MMIVWIDDIIFPPISNICCDPVMNTLTYGTNQPQLERETRANQKNVCHMRAHAKIHFCVCLRVLFESVAEWIYSCWIIVSRRFKVLNRAL